MNFKEIGIDGVYVVHAKTGYEYHEKRIVDLFSANGIEFEFTTEGDPSLFTDELLAKYFTPDISLSPGVKSCTLNHILSYEKMVKNNNHYALIFENDPFFLGNFVDKIATVMKEVKERKLENFIISLENTCLVFPTIRDTKKDKNIYDASFGRAAGAYLIDLSAAKNIINDIKICKCHTVIDWWHNSLFDRGIVQIYWAHPAMVEQGSHNGMLCSTISSKRNSLVRRISWNLQKIYKIYILRSIIFLSRSHKR